MVVDWFRKSGYNDYLSPICYVHNQARKHKKDVHLNFVYQYCEGVREEMEHPDSEAVETRIQYLFDNTFKADIECSVTIGFEYNKTVSQSHVNYYDEDNRYHNYRMSSSDVRWEGGSDHIVVIGTSNNLLKFKDYAQQKVWKDPIGDRWGELVSELSSAQVVDYTTPIEEAVKALRTAKMVIGYHGGPMHLARWMGVPGIVVSGSKNTSRAWMPNFYHAASYMEALIASDSYKSVYKMNDININMNNIELEKYLCAV